MILQWIAVITILAAALIYIIFKLKQKKDSRQCDDDCPGCPLADKCNKRV